MKKKILKKILTKSSKKNKNKKNLLKKTKTQREREKKKKKKKKKPPSVKKKGWRHQTHRTQWRRKKKESESKVAVGGSLGVCLITEMPLKIELWKLKTPKMCFQFPSLITQKSKNKVMETKTKNNWKQKPNELLSYGSHHFWVMSYENKIMSYRNSKSKHPLSFLLTKRSRFSCLLCFLF